MMKMLHATVSHDMMAPILNIKFFAEKMLKSGEQHNVEDLRKFYQLIVNSSKLVYCRMKDLLDQNLIEHNIFVPVDSEFLPHQAVLQITNMFESSMRDQDVKIVTTSNFTKDQTLIGDVNRIQQVLVNLVSNACKFVPKKADGVIEVDFNINDASGAVTLLEISVTDNGPGISAED